MRRLNVKARPSKYVFVDLYEDHPFAPPHYLFIDYCTVHDVKLYSEMNPKLVVVSEDYFRDFVLTHSVDFLGIGR